MVLVIILKRGIRLIKRMLITMAGTVPVIIARMMIMERMLVVLEYKKGGKDGCYRLY